MKINPTAAIAGTHIRYDIPTKCQIVAVILSNTYSSKKGLNAFIAVMATKYAVSSAAIKIWCAKYGHTYKQGVTLPAGTMSYEFTPLQQRQIQFVGTQLTNIRSELTALRTTYHPTQKSTPSDILDELISAK